MKVILDSLLRVQDVPDSILELIKSDLTIKNPEYQRKKLMKLPFYTWGEEWIKLWSLKTVNDQATYILPRGYFARLYEISGGSFDLSDNRVLCSEILYPKRPVLRDYQQPALKQAKNWQQGAIIMPCGSGKTEVGLAEAAYLHQPTLWLTHTMDLLNQSMERAHTRLGLSGNQIGVIQGKKNTIGTHMTFATVQTLAKRDLSEIRNKFGCIIIDEAHMVFKDDKKARMFESVISQFPAFYRFGLTASKHRSDGLIDTMFYIIGHKIYEVFQENLNSAGNVMVPKVEFIETCFKYEPPEDEDGEKEMLNVQQMIKAMREDSVRDSVILNIFCHRIQPEDCCLVLGDSLEHLEYLCGFVSKQLNATAAFVCGTTPKRERERIMRDMRDGEYQYLFATYQLAKLGLDIPRLNRLILATPKRDKTSIQQAVGRIMRPFEGKGTPVVYDVYDKGINQLRYWARDRVRVYKSLGCEVIGGPKIRKY